MMSLIKCTVKKPLLIGSTGRKRRVSSSGIKSRASLPKMTSLSEIHYLISGVIAQLALGNLLFKAYI